MMGILTSNLMFDLVTLTAVILSTIIFYFKYKFKYWEKQGLPSPPTTVPFGNVRALFLKKRSFGEEFQAHYKTAKSKGLRHVGIYFGWKPFYVPVDLNIVKHMLQTDFQHFVNHGFYTNEKTDPLTINLFNMEDLKWKNMRVKLTPTFTSGKMKMMFQTLADCGVGLKELMDQCATKEEPVDIKDILGRFSTDIISSCAFGLESNCLKDPDSEFRKYGKRVFEIVGFEQVKLMMAFSLPHSFLDFIGLKMTSSGVEEFFMNLVQKTVNYRETNNIYRKDFMHLLLQLKNKGFVSDDASIIDGDGKAGEKTQYLTVDEVAAQAFVFFGAGFETSSTTMTFALYELATNPDVQEKLRNEIRTVLAKHDNKITYDNIMEMTYLDKVINETLRKYPPVPMLPRVCTKDYTIPNTSVQIKKGTDAMIPVYGIHHDPEYYPEPEKFDPERFSEENKSKRPPLSWIPFGEGPRLCIGLRFGLMQTKVGLITMINNYRITLNEKTKSPLVMDKISFIMSAEDGVWLDVEKIN